MKIGELLTYIIATLLALFCLIGGLTTDFFGLVQEGPGASVASAVTAISLFVIGDRIASVLRGKYFVRNIEKIVHSITQSTPDLYCIIEFPSSDNAMVYLCSRLPFTKTVLNTKISKDAIPPRRDIGDKYVVAIKAALNDGIVYKDIVSTGFKGYAEDLSEYQSTVKGTYQFSLLDSNDPAFLNFIILEYKDNQEELIIGWATSPYVGTEQKAYMIRDRRIISYFKTYHAALYQQLQSAI